MNPNYYPHHFNLLDSLVLNKRLEYGEANSIPNVFFPLAASPIARQDLKKQNRSLLQP